MPIKLFIKTVLIIFGFVCLTSCKDEKTRTTSEDKVTVSFKHEGTLNIIKIDSDSIIKTIDIEIADDEYTTQTGLMYRTKLETNHGMLFIFPDEQMRSFYMKNTKIPLDIIYLDEDKTIVSFQKNAQPMKEKSLPSAAPAKYVLEIKGGLSDEWQLETGDKINFTTVNE